MTFDEHDTPLHRYERKIQRVLDLMRSQGFDQEWTRQFSLRLVPGNIDDILALLEAWEQSHGSNPTEA